jgi:hypothetical protein
MNLPCKFLNISACLSVERGHGLGVRILRIRKVLGAKDLTSILETHETFIFVLYFELRLCFTVRRYWRALSITRGRAVMAIALGS